MSVGSVNFNHILNYPGVQLFSTTRPIKPPKPGPIGACGTGAVIDLTDDGVYGRDVVKGTLAALSCMEYRGAHSGFDPRETDGNGASFSGTNINELIKDSVDPECRIASGIFSLVDNKKELDAIKGFIKTAESKTGLQASFLPIDVNQGEEIFGPRYEKRDFKRLVVTNKGYSQEEFKQQCQKFYLILELKMHAYYTKEYETDKPKMLSRSHLFSLDPDIIVYKTLARGKDLHNIFPELDTLTAKRGIPHTRMSTDTEGGCIFSAQPTPDGTGHNGQNNAHHKITTNLETDPELKKLVGEVTVDYMSDSLKMALQRLHFESQGTKSEDVIKGFFPKSVGEVPLLEGKVVGVNGPAMMYFHTEKEIVSCLDRTGFRYASKIEIPNKFVSMMSEASAAYRSIPESLKSEVSGDIQRPGAGTRENVATGTPLTSEAIEPETHSKYNTLFHKSTLNTAPKTPEETLMMDSFLENKPYVPTTVSMGKADDPKPNYYRAWTDFFNFSWPMVGGPVLAPQEENLINTSIMIGNKLAESPFLSTDQVEALLNGRNKIECVYDPRGRGEKSRQDALEKSLQEVLAKVDGQITPETHTIVLSDSTANSFEISIPSCILLPQVHQRVSETGKNISIIYESQQLRTPKEAMIALNLGATGVGMRGLENYVAGIGTNTAINFHDQLTSMLRYYLAGAGITSVSDYIGSKTLYSIVPMSPRLQRLTGITSPEQTTIEDASLSLRRLARICLNTEFYTPVRNPSIWLEMVKLRNFTKNQAERAEFDKELRNVSSAGLRLAKPTKFTDENPLNISVIGAGMAGLETVKSISEVLGNAQIPINIYLIEQGLGNIAGLVHSGIHFSKTLFKERGKNAFEDVLKMPNLRYSGGVTVTDFEKINAESIVIDASGSGEMNRLGIPGEDEAINTGKLTGARKHHEGYNKQYSPKIPKQIITYNPSSPILGIIGSGGVSFDIARVMTEKNPNNLINPEWLKTLGASFKTVRIFQRNPNPDKAAFPESDIPKLEKHIENGVAFRAHIPSEFREPDSTQTAQGAFIRSATISEMPQRNQATTAIEFFCGYTPESFVPNKDEISVLFEGGQRHTMGHVVSAIGEKSKEKTHDFSVGWAKTLGDLSSLPIQAKKVAEEIRDNILRGQYSEKLTYTQSNESALEELFLRAAIRNNQQLRLIEAARNGVDLTDLPTYLSVIEGSAMTQETAMQGEESLEPELKFPPSTQDVITIGINGKIINSKPSEETIYEFLRKKDEIPAEECDGLGTCGGCTAFIPSDSPVNIPGDHASISRALYPKTPPGTKPFLSCSIPGKELTGTPVVFKREFSTTPSTSLPAKRPIPATVARRAFSTFTSLLRRVKP